MSFERISIQWRISLLSGCSLLAVVAVVLGITLYQAHRNAELFKHESTRILEESAKARLEASAVAQKLRIEHFFRSIELYGDGIAGQVLQLRTQHAGAASSTDTLRKQLAQARAAWDERRRVRAHWPVVRRIARDLALGRRRLEVRIEDAHASALCTVGIEGFLRRIGLGRVRRVSGRTAALLMALEPQVGFVILAAHERAHGRLPDPAARNDDTRGLRLA